MRKQTSTFAALSFLVPKALKETLQDLAEADQRNLSNYLRRALERHVEQQREGKKK